MFKESILNYAEENAMINIQKEQSKKPGGGCFYEKEKSSCGR